MIKGFKVRLFPNETQTQLLWKHVNVSRFVWNYALAEQLNRYKNGEKHLNKYGMRDIFIALKQSEDYAWLKEVSAHTIGNVCIDLDKAYIYIIKYLTDNHFKCTIEDLKTNTFSYVYKSGKCNNIKLKTNSSTIVFVNFKSKFGVEFGNYNENKELIDYAIAHNRVGYSLGKDAYNEFVTGLFNTRYNEFTAHQIMRADNHFPIFKYSTELLEAKNNVSGYQMCKQGTYQNIFEYDISSSYPAQLLCNTPTGLPKLYNNLNDIPETYFKVITFTYYNNKGIKPNKIDFIQTSELGQITLTQNLFELFKENYDCNIIIKNVIAFKTQKSPFVKFITNNIINGKMRESRPHIAKYNKYIGNAIIGYFGRNAKTTENIAESTQYGLKTSTVDKDIDPIYLPVYLSVLDRAKTAFIHTLQDNIDSIIYANTDGFLSTRPIDVNLLNINNCLKIGNYRNKNIYAQIYIEAINGYAGITASGEIDNTLSGMTLDDVISPEQYRTRQFKYYINIPTENGTICRKEIQPL